VNGVSFPCAGFVPRLVSSSASRGPTCRPAVQGRAVAVLKPQNAKALGRYPLAEVQDFHTHDVIGRVIVQNDTGLNFLRFHYRGFIEP